MRLWTFQDRGAEFAIRQGLVWKSTKKFGNRIRPEDGKYVIKYPDGLVENPIYCFSKIGVGASLSLKTIVTSFESIEQRYSLDISRLGAWMFELEVPEDFILNCKICGNSKLEYIEYNEFLKYTRYIENHDVECVIDEIRPEWVVAVRVFYKFDSYWVCKTIKEDADLNPCWTSHIGGKNGFPILMVDGSPRVYETRSEMEMFYKTHSMSGVPKYYTISECLYCCNAATCSAVMSQVYYKMLSKSQYSSMTIDELFDFRLP